jgi:hypothetical protein
MLYQSHAIFSDKRPVTCVILDNSESMWEVEYNNGGTIVTTKVDPKELTPLDYCERDLSQ